MSVQATIWALVTMVVWGLVGLWGGEPLSRGLGALLEMSATPAAPTPQWLDPGQESVRIWPVSRQERQ